VPTGALKHARPALLTPRAGEKKMSAHGVAPCGHQLQRRPRRGDNYHRAAKVGQAEPCDERMPAVLRPSERKASKGLLWGRQNKPDGRPRAQN
jgi:hypothetical protein